MNSISYCFFNSHQIAFFKGENREIAIKLASENIQSTFIGKSDDLHRISTNKQGFVINFNCENIQTDFQKVRCKICNPKCLFKFAQYCR